MIREEKSHVHKGPQKTSSESSQKTPFDKAIEANPRLAAAYYDRANAFYNKGEYEKVWEDIDRARSLGYQVPKKFLKALRKVSGRAG
jgi:tetratricopeptide (TPR) repeat protein